MKALLRIGSALVLLGCQQFYEYRRDQELRAWQQDFETVYTPPPPRVTQQTVYTPPPIPEWMDIPVLVTAYTPHDVNDGHHWSTKDFVTSTNKDWRAHPYGVASDPAALPYGTQVKIPGYMDVSYPNTAWAIDDTGGEMRKNWRKKGIIHLDLRYTTTHSALQWSPRWQMVWVRTNTLTLDTLRELLRYRERNLCRIL